MSSQLSIGEFARMTHLSVKALRHYHEHGILEPHDIDTVSGYRYYDLEQLPDAHVIRRLRDLEMPLDDVRDVLGAESNEARNEAISRHLTRMEAELARTRATVTSLRELLTGDAPDLEVTHRRIEPCVAMIRRDAIGLDQTEPWFRQAFLQLERAARRSGSVATDPSFAMFDGDFFAEGSGSVMAAVPIHEPEAGESEYSVERVGGGEYAVVVHRGPYEDLDRAYGAVGAYVNQHGIGADGAIRENYLIGPDVETDPSRLLTEICWPITRPR